MKFKYIDNKKMIVIGVILCTLIISLSFALVKKEAELNNSIAKRKVNNIKYNTNTIAMYQSDDGTNYTEINKMPGSDYIINESKSYCTIDNKNKDDEAILKTIDGNHVISGLTTGDKCYLYFDILDNTAPTISNVAISVTKSEISVTITASDDKGLSKYYYKIDSGSYVEKTTNTHIFTGLAAGSTHTISVYVTDKMGNQSTITTRAVTTNPDGQTASSILAGLTKSTRTDFSTTLTTNTTGTIYTAADGDGTSYYYAGAVDNNWVKFGGFYWRIVRFNGDGTIRLIYNGNSTSLGTGTYIELNSFNASNNDKNNMYAGYMYTNGQVHGLETASTIKEVLDNWYTSNLASYADKIDSNAGFCNDREPSTSSLTSNGGGGTGSTETYYGAYLRNTAAKNPSFKCKNTSDLFTKSGATKGNRALTNSVGLITADEVVYAGGSADAGVNNSGFYLYTTQYYWTMSPYNYYSDVTNIFCVTRYGGLNGLAGSSMFGVRPVINLKANTLFVSGGTGTSSNPYVVEGAA